MVSPMVFPTRLDPISNITGFTYRTGSTFQEILIRLSDYIQTTLPDEFNGSLGKLFNDVNDISVDWEEKFTAFMADVEAELAILNDAAVAGLITTPASAIRTALDALYSVSDASVKGLLLNIASQTRVELDTIIADVNDYTAGDGYKYAVLAGVIRNDGVNPVYWEILGNGHRAVNIDRVETWSDKIRVFYENLNAEMTISFIAVPDETLARAGIITGCSVGPEHADIFISQVSKVISDYVYYDGTNWKSQDDVYTDIYFNGGILYLTHDPIPAESVYNVNLTPRGGGYVYAIGRGNSPTTSTDLKIDVRDMTGASVLTPTTDMTLYVSRGGGMVDIVPKDLDTVKYPASNIWLYGIMGLDRGPDE